MPLVSFGKEIEVQATGATDRSRSRWSPGAAGCVGRDAKTCFPSRASCTGLQGTMLKPSDCLLYASAEKGARTARRGLWIDSRLIVPSD